MSFLKNRKTKLYVFFVVLLIGITYLFFNEFGILKYIQLKNELDSLEQKITKADDENKFLEGEIDSLKRKVPAKIEQISREKYDMMREGEVKIEVKETEE